MGVIARPLPVRPVPWRLLAVAAVILLLAVSALAYVASRPHQLPAPFGLAANGQLYYADPAGDIFSVDPTSLQAKAIITGGDGFITPLPSRDGRSLIFERATGDQFAVMAADQDGSHVRALSGTYSSINELDWSPDSSRLAVLSMIDGRSTVSVLPMDGSPAMRLDPGLDVRNFWYLPDGRIVFIGTSTGAAPLTNGPYIMDGDGTDAHPISTPTTNDGDWLGLALSPDGDTLAYHLWHDPDEHGRLYTLDIGTGVSKPVPVTASGPWEEEYEDVEFSPDGQSLLFSRFTDCCRTLAVVPVTGGPAVDIGEKLGEDSGDVASTFFAPDGKSLVAYYPSLKQLWLLDATGNTKGRQLQLEVTDVPTWQRVAP